VRDVQQLDTALQALHTAAARGIATPARFLPGADKRANLELALDHLVTHAPSPVEEIGLPARGSPWGTVQLDQAACTLCLSCVNACPAAALQDNPQLPQLRFIEKNCVQCGLCVSTCPEQALSLQPRLLMTPGRKEPRVLHESQPYACIRCSKPFGTLKAIESMLGRLAGHSMFQGVALQRLKMCSDCRVIDLFTAENQSRITDL